MKVYCLEKFTSLGDLRLQDEVDQRPQRGELLIRVHAVSLNLCDIALIRGRCPVPHHQGLMTTSDRAGEIIEVEEEVVDFRISDRGKGSFHSHLWAI